MKVFTLQGYSKSGKTTSAEYIIKELRKRGYSVGTVKNIHQEGFSIDTPGTNTDRHRKAGSQLVTARGLAETDILYEEKLPLQQILRFYNQDFVLIEGGNELKVPKILTGVTIEDIEAHWQEEEQVIAICGKLSGECEGNQKSDAPKERRQYRNVPIINATTETAYLVDLIEKAVPHYDVDHAAKKEVELTINGQKIFLNQFVEPTLRDTIIGFVKNLKGYEEGTEIVIRLQ